MLSEQEEKGKRRHFLCRCECGNETVVEYSHLRGGTTKSCGCLRREIGRKRKNIQGNRYGFLTVTSKTTQKDEQGNRGFCCTCDCGTTLVVPLKNLHSGKTKSCGCLSRELKKHRETGLIGGRYGQLVVLREYTKKGTSWYFICKCDCGRETIVKYLHLIASIKESCGCVRKKLHVTEEE